jgi:predicted kinase
LGEVVEGVKPRLILFSGLPGTGKSRLAEAAGQELGMPVFARDWLEVALWRVGLNEEAACADKLGYAGYELMTTLARRQLAMGQSAVLDSVAGVVAVREAWRALAAEYGAGWYVIECICSDEGLHRARLTTRRRAIPGWYEVTWEQVERVRGRYVAWEEERLVVDGVRPFEENLGRVMAYVGRNLPHGWEETRMGRRDEDAFSRTEGITDGKRSGG